MNKLLLKKWSKGNDLENTEGVADTHSTTETLQRKNNNSTTRERASTTSFTIKDKYTLSIKRQIQLCALSKISMLQNTCYFMAII